MVDESEKVPIQGATSGQSGAKTSHFAVLSHQTPMIESTPAKLQLEANTVPLPRPH